MSSVTWVLFKRCVPGDRRKALNESNDHPTEGGGARDLRFNPWKDFENVVAQMFPKSRPAKPNDPTDTRVVQIAPVYWWDNHQCGPVDVEFWPPTNARPFEGRLARIAELDPFAGVNLPPQQLDPFFMLWRDGSKVWAKMVTVPDLQNPGWASSVSTPILKAVGARSATDNIRGWVNAQSGLHYIA